MVRVTPPKESLQECRFVFGRTSPMLTEIINMKSPILLRVKANFLDILSDWRERFIAAILEFVEHDEEKVNFGIGFDGGEEVGKIGLWTCVGLRIPDGYDSNVGGRMAQARKSGGL